jgi:hypothetical protein
VLVTEAGGRERDLEPLRVRPRVLVAADAAALPHVEHDAHVGVAQRVEERVACPAVDADRDDSSHGGILNPT